MDEILAKNEGKVTAYRKGKKGLIAWKENTGVWINIPDEKLAIELLTSSTKENTLVNTNKNFKENISDNNDITLWVNLEETKVLLDVIRVRTL